MQRAIIVFVIVMVAAVLLGSVAFVVLSPIGNQGTGTSTSSSSSTMSGSSSQANSPTQGVASVYLPGVLPAKLYITPGASENYSVIRLVPLGGDLNKSISLKVISPAGLSLVVTKQSVILSQGEQRVGLSLMADSTVQKGEYQAILETTTGGSSKNTTITIDVVSQVIFMQGAMFTPRSVTVSVGSTVSWVDLDGALSQYDPGTHNVIFVDGRGSPSMSQYDTFSRTFGTLGTFRYDCTFHPGMDGTITVTG